MLLTNVRQITFTKICLLIVAFLVANLGTDAQADFLRNINCQDFQEIEKRILNYWDVRGRKEASESCNDDYYTFALAVFDLEQLFDTDIPDSLRHSLESPSSITLLTTLRTKWLGKRTLGSSNVLAKEIEIGSSFFDFPSYYMRRVKLSISSFDDSTNIPDTLIIRLKRASAIIHEVRHMIIRNWAVRSLKENSADLPPGGAVSLAIFFDFVRNQGLEHVQCPWYRRAYYGCDKRFVGWEGGAYSWDVMFLAQVAVNPSATTKEKFAATALLVADLFYYHFQEIYQTGPNIENTSRYLPKRLVNEKFYQFSILRIRRAIETRKSGNYR